MDLLVVCADAGLSMEAALDRVGRELADSYRSLSANVHMATLEMRAGRTLSETLDHLADRLGLEEARSFATLLQQSEKLGSSLTEALRVYSDDMRHKRLSRALAEYTIDQSTLARDAARPPSSQIMLERLRLTRSPERITASTLDEII